MPNNVATYQHNMFYARDVDPTALHGSNEYPTPTRDLHNNKRRMKENAVGADWTVMSKGLLESQAKGDLEKGSLHPLHSSEGAKKAPQQVDHNKGKTLSAAYSPCDYTRWDNDHPPINTSSSAYKNALCAIRKHFPTWQHEVALFGEILLRKINTREQRHALIEVAKSFGFNPSSPRSTTCSFVYVKYTNNMFMRATGENIPYLGCEIAHHLQRLEERHHEYMEWRYQQEARNGNAGNESRGGAPNHASEGEGVGEGNNKERVPKAGEDGIEQQRSATEGKGSNYQQASSARQLPQPYVLQWWFVDRFAHRDVLELLRLLACEIGVFRGQPTLSFEQLQRYDADAARSLENSMTFRVEVALEYQPRWEVELKALLKEEPGSARDPYPISYIRRDNFAMKQYQNHLRPFFYDWRPIVTRCFVDLIQGRDFRAGTVPSNVTAMGTAFFLRHEIDTKGQVFYRRWVRHSLDLFGGFSTDLRKQDEENVRKTLTRLCREHPRSVGGAVRADSSPDCEVMLDLLKQAKNGTPHFGALNLCIEFRFFKKDLSELQKFSVRYGYFLYIRRDEGMVYVAATARDLPVLPPQRFELFFLPNGAYVGPAGFQPQVDMRMGRNGEALGPVPPSLVSLLAERSAHVDAQHGRRSKSWSSCSSSLVAGEERDGRPPHRGRVPCRGGRSRSSSSSASSRSSLCSSSDASSFASCSYSRGRSRSLSSAMPRREKRRRRSVSPKRQAKDEPMPSAVAKGQPRRYGVLRSLPASSLYDAMVGPTQRLHHPPGCTVESHLVESSDGRHPLRVLHFAVNHLTREAHVIGG